MYRRKIHEQHRDAFDPVGVKSGYRSSLRAESSGRHHGHGVAEGVERRHAGKDVGQRRQSHEREIDIRENVHHAGRPRRIAAAGQRTQLHVGQTHAHLAGLRNDQQQEDHDSETADEMSGRTPEQQAVRQGLHVAQNRRPAGRVAADRLENRVRQGEGAAPEHIRQQTEQERQQPRERDDHIALAQRYRGRLAHEYEREYANDEGDRERDHQSRQRGVVAVRHGNEHREQHEQRVDEQREAYVPYDYLPVHFFLRSLTLRRSCWFSPASSEMPSLSSTSWSSPSKLTVYFLSLDR